MRDKKWAAQWVLGSRVQLLLEVSFFTHFIFSNTILADLTEWSIYGKTRVRSTGPRPYTFAPKAFIQSQAGNRLLACMFYIRVFPILYWISLIMRIRWIQLKLVNNDWRLLNAFQCHPLTVGSVLWKTVLVSVSTKSSVEKNLRCGCISRKVLQDFNNGNSISHNALALFRLNNV